MRRPPETVQIAALGLIQGVAEVLPVSSSAHVAAVPWLLRWEVAEWEPARRKEFEVALHAGAAVALAPSLLRLLPDARTVVLSLVPPVIVGYALERPIEERLGALWPGLLAGGVALALADWSGPRRARGIGARGSVALGLAQAAALVPGVSRTGATLAAARALGYDRAEASRLSFGVAGPVLVGATALKAWRARRRPDARLAVGAATAFAGARASLRLLGIERKEPWWPYAAERALLAGAILAVRYRRRGEH